MSYNQAEVYRVASYDTCIYDRLLCTPHNLDEKDLKEQLNYFEHKRIPRIVYAEKAIGNVLYILYEGANINLGRKNIRKCIDSNYL